MELPWTYGPCAYCPLLSPGVCQVRIQDLVKGGPQLLRPKVADVAKRAFCGWGPGPA